MAKKYKTSLKRSNAFYMDFDSQKLANAIEKAGGKIKPAIEAASRRSLPLIQREFSNFASQHKVSGKMSDSLIDASETKFIWGKEAKKRYVGTTTKGKKGFTGGKVEIVSEEDCLFFEYGFDASKGGVKALYLDIGTPKRTPKRGQVKGTYFIHYAVERNMGKIHAIQKQELTRILEGLK